MTHTATPIERIRYADCPDALADPYTRAGIEWGAA